MAREGKGYPCQRHDMMMIIVMMQREFFSPAGTFQRNPSDKKASQLSRTFLGILANFGNAVVRVLSVLLIFSSSILFSRFIGTVERTLGK